MLLYLSTYTRPGIAFAVSQVARFTSNPMQSHATAVKTIVRYLWATLDKGTIMKPTDELTVDMQLDADFAGLYSREPDTSEDAVRSPTGYILLFSGCPLIWKSQLQTFIAQPTLEAEDGALSHALCALLPLKRISEEVCLFLTLPRGNSTSVRARLFEDNQGAYYLAVNQQLTNRMKYILIKFHWFWSHYNAGEFTICKVDSVEQLADYLTKGLACEVFERIPFVSRGGSVRCHQRNG
jgi:hypothetical protein